MRYLIDGYNLLHAMGLLSHNKTAPKALEAARFDLLDRLHAFFGDNSHLLTVIFDAARVPRRGQSVSDYHGIHVRYALHQEADDLIEILIQGEATPKTLTIVSDDHRLQTAARRGHCALLSCDHFLDVAEKPARANSSKPPNLSGKPETVSPEERQRWLDEFAALDDDPALKNWLDQSTIELDD